MSVPDVLPILVPFMGGTLLLTMACMGCMWRSVVRRMDATETRLGEMLATRQPVLYPPPPSAPPTTGYVGGFYPVRV